MSDHVFLGSEQGAGFLDLRHDGGLILPGQLQVTDDIQLPLPEAEVIGFHIAVVDVEVAEPAVMLQDELLILSAGAEAVPDIEGQAEAFRLQQDLDGLLMEGPEPVGVLDAEDRPAALQLLLYYLPL